MSVPTAKDMREFDRKVLLFYHGRIAAGSTDPVGETSAEFGGEDVSWCVDPKPFTYSDGVKDNPTPLRSPIDVIEVLTRECEGIDEDTDVRDLIVDELNRDPYRSYETIAHAVAQRIVQA